MNARVIFIVLLFSLIFIHSSVVYADWQPNYPADYCEVKSRTPLQLIIWCNEDVLFTEYGLFISVDYSAGYRSLTIMRSYDLINWRYVIIVVFTVSNEGKILINLPPGRDYAGQRVDAWNFTYWYSLDESGAQIAESNIILMPSSWSTKGWEFGNDFNIGQILLKPANMSAVVVPAPSPPAWHDIVGWVNFFSYLLSEVAKAIPTALSIFANGVMYLLQISPFLLLIIPLHIIFSFIEDPSRGISTINFYVSLARKFIDLLVKIIQAIIEAIGHMIPG